MSNANTSVHPLPSRRGGRWKTSPNVILLRVGPTTTTRVTYRRQSFGLLTSFALHALLLLAAALVMVPSAQPILRTVLLCGAQIDGAEEEPIIEIVPSAVAEETVESARPFEQSLATPAAPSFDPGTAMAGAPDIEFDSTSLVSRQVVVSETAGMAATAGRSFAAAGNGTGGELEGGKGNYDARFFGVRAVGDKFVFVVDCSRSMEGTKWTEVKRELLASLNRLSERKSFYVVFFDGEMHPMFSPAEQTREPIPATRENLTRFQTWLAGLELGRNTSPFTAIKLAVSLEPDAIFLLTDGEFSDFTAPYLRGVHEKRRKLNASPIAVHTIGYFERKHQMVLQRIARDARSMYQFVAETDVP